MAISNSPTKLGRMQVGFFLAGALTGVLATVVLVGPFYSWRSMFTMTDSEARILATEAGNLIASAIYAYREREGQWPEELETLVPQDLSTLPNTRWRLRSGDGDASLIGKTGWESDSIEFDFTDPQRGWWRNGEPLHRDGPPTSPPASQPG